MDGTPDWNLLPLFVAVVESGSMSAAARKLGAPKSSVSRGVAALEKSLGVQLLHRTTRDVQLTSAGHGFYERARPVLSSYRAFTTIIPEQELEPSETLRITTPVDMGLTFLVDVFANFMARYPKVTLDVSPTNTPPSILPAHLAHADVLAGRLVRVVPEWKLDRASLFLHPQAQHVPRKVTAFRDYLHEVLAQRPLGEVAR